MICGREMLPGFCAAGVALVLLGLMGCGGESSAGTPAEYPLVVPKARATREPVAIYKSEPSSSCERSLATYHDGSKPTRRPIIVPPMPGLRAVAVSEHTTRVEWTFLDLPADCRPVAIRLAVTGPKSSPTGEQVDMPGVGGSREITSPEFLPLPTVAIASAYTADGARSRTAAVRIKRPADVAPDPPDPLPPVTAPAGLPLTCTGRATVVDDPSGDVLIYAPGSPPKQVLALTPILSGIDITRASVQIDGRTLCATFVFAKPPGDADFWLTLNLVGAGASSCCSSLRFRRTAGRLEVGLHVTNKTVYELRPVRGAGAALRDDTLIVTGTLPSANASQYPTRRIPALENVGWSASTGYVPTKYGPFYGDWIPRYEPTREPVIRQRDGATVQVGQLGTTP